MLMTESQIVSRRGEPQFCFALRTWEKIQTIITCSQMYSRPGKKRIASSHEFLDINLVFVNAFKS